MLAVLVCLVALATADAGASYRPNGKRHGYAGDFGYLASQPRPLFKNRRQVSPDQLSKEHGIKGPYRYGYGIWYPDYQPAYPAYFGYGDDKDGSRSDYLEDSDPYTRSQAPGTPGFETARVLSYGARPSQAPEDRDYNYRDRSNGDHLSQTPASNRDDDTYYYAHQGKHEYDNGREVQGAYWVDQPHSEWHVYYNVQRCGGKGGYYVTRNGGCCLIRNGCCVARASDTRTCRDIVSRDDGGVSRDGGGVSSDGGGIVGGYGVNGGHAGGGYGTNV